MTAQTLTHHAAHHDPEAARRAVEMFEAEEKRALDRKELVRGRVFASGRILLAGTFFVAALDKILNFNAESLALFNLDVGDPSAVLFGALVVESVGALLLALGWQTRRVAVGLAVYLGLVSLLAMAYFPPAFATMFLIANVGLVGGLLFLVANGAGPLSIDARKELKEELARAK
ncbi:MAG: DoxX family protein [Myxococcaceae bacterium]